MSYLDILQQQKNQIISQSQMALENIEKIIALHTAQNTPPAPAPTPAKSMEPAEMNEMIINAVQNYIAKNLGPMAQSISIEDQQWLSANLLKFPGFLNSKSGQECVALMIDAFKQHEGVK